MMPAVSMGTVWYGDRARNLVMQRLISLFVDICLLRSGPQDLPTSTVLLILALLANAAAGVLMLQVSTPPGTSVLIVLFDTVLMVAFVSIVLQLRGHPERRVQTITALGGTGMLFSLMNWPVTGWWYRAKEAGAETGVPLLALMVLLVWNIIVIGHILRHALDVSLPSGIGISLIYVLIAMSLIGVVFPAAN